MGFHERALHLQCMLNVDHLSDTMARFPGKLRHSFICRSYAGLMRELDLLQIHLVRNVNIVLHFDMD